MSVKTPDNIDYVLEGHVRLTGLRGAAHLNGREGVILREDPNNAQRVIVRLIAGGEEVRSPLTSLCFPLSSLLSPAPALCVLISHPSPPGTSSSLAPRR